MNTPPGYQYQLELLWWERRCFLLVILISILILEGVYTVLYLTVALDYWGRPLTGKRILYKKRRTFHLLKADVSE